MTLPEKVFQQAVKDDTPDVLGRRLERNFQELDSGVTSGESRLTALEGRLTDWTSWTPTWANVTTTSATIAANYARVDDTVFFIVTFVLGASSAIGTAPTFTLPVTAGNTFLGNARFFDDDAGVNYEGRCDLASLTTAGLACATTSGTYLTRTGLTASIPFTWATDDSITATGFYQAA